MRKKRNSFGNNNLVTPLERFVATSNKKPAAAAEIEAELEELEAEIEDEIEIEFEELEEADND